VNVPLDYLFYLPDECGLVLPRNNAEGISPFDRSGLFFNNYNFVQSFSSSESDYENYFVGTEYVMSRNLVYREENKGECVDTITVFGLVIGRGTSETGHENWYGTSGEAQVNIGTGQLAKETREKLFDILTGETWHELNANEASNYYNEMLKAHETAVGIVEQIFNDFEKLCKGDTLNTRLFQNTNIGKAKHCQYERNSSLQEILEWISEHEC
jgi:hypothetical protein